MKKKIAEIIEDYKVIVILIWREYKFVLGFLFAVLLLGIISLDPQVLKQGNKAGSSFPLTRSQPIEVQFDPQPDITAYELAKIVEYLHGKIINDSEWNNMSTNVKRHLKKVK